ncbi:hypothetical protein NB311A_08203 [Nitrobacter sp. Nb-311A]|nr:hypothetical protein NB311A_08203 [Nitrobacter sp. Nb-311A]
MGGPVPFFRSSPVVAAPFDANLEIKGTLLRFRATRIPLRVKKTRQIKIIDRTSDASEAGRLQQSELSPERGQKFALRTRRD